MTVRDLLRTLPPIFDRPMASFDPEKTPDEPVGLFGRWFQEAIEAGVQEPHVMMLATADGDGAPDTRALTLRNVDSSGWCFTTSSTSVKGTQLAADPRVALGFYWREQGRQVRVRGRAVRASDKTCAEDFLARPQNARAHLLIGRHGVLVDPDVLATETEAAQRRLAETPGLVAESHGVYVVDPIEVEFSQSDRQWKHVRLRYRATEGGWVKERLWP